MQKANKDYKITSEKVRDILLTLEYTPEILHEMSDKFLLIKDMDDFLFKGKKLDTIDFYAICHCTGLNKVFINAGFKDRQAKGVVKDEAGLVIRHVY